jgi:uncharacterized membrane protein
MVAAAASQKDDSPSMNRFLKATIVGGVLFLLPLAIVVMVLAYALRMASVVARPISDQLGLHQLGEFAGIGIVTIVSAVLLIVVSLAAGLAARTYLGERVTRGFENSLLGRLPQYQMVKSMAEGLAQLESDKGIKPALVSIEGGWQVGYLIEPLEKGWVSVFLPQAPTPMSGNVMYFPAERVRPLDITMVEAMTIIKRIGVGSGTALKGVDLELPPGQS